MTQATALVVRCFMGSLIGVGAFSPAVIALGIGGVTAAWFAARLLSHITNHRLERAIAVLLVAIGLLLIGERFLRAGLPALVPAEAGWQIVAGVGAAGRLCPPHPGIGMTAAASTSLARTGSMVILHTGHVPQLAAREHGVAGGIVARRQS